MVERICQYCGKSFLTKPSRIKIGKGKYCSRECYHKSKVRREARVCPVCSIVFYCKPSARKRFCSPRCQASAITLRETRICLVCGSEFETKPSVDQRYCSCSCYAQARIEETKKKREKAERHICAVCGTDFVSYNEGQKYCSKRCGDIGKRKRIVQRCKMCGRKFEVSISVAAKGQGLFCSRQCWREWKKVSSIGDKNPNWRGGQSSAPYPIAFNKPFKTKIRKRDGHRCAICRLSGCDVHHIDYDKDNTVPRNCITLCSSCHGRTNIHRGYWQGVLTTLMQTRQEAEYVHAT